MYVSCTYVCTYAYIHACMFVCNDDYDGDYGEHDYYDCPLTAMTIMIMIGWPLEENVLESMDIHSPYAITTTTATTTAPRPRPTPTL